jgi:hypothetical protein
METGLILYGLLFVLGINGLILIGIKNQREQQRRLYEDAIKQLRVVSISRGRRF